MDNIATIMAICESQLDLLHMYRKRMNEFKERAANDSSYEKTYQVWKADFKEAKELYRSKLNILLDEVEECKDYVEDQLAKLDQMREE